MSSPVEAYSGRHDRTGSVTRPYSDVATGGFLGEIGSTLRQIHHDRESQALEERLAGAAEAQARQAFRRMLNKALMHQPGDAVAALYRPYDADDNLLYVGITNNLARRQWQHMATATWSKFADRLEVDWWTSADGLGRAEQEEIQRHQPLWNMNYNNTPDARIRLVGYLVRKNRLDLLAPMMTNPRIGERPVTWST